jgi:hypothetical protein
VDRDQHVAGAEGRGAPGQAALQQLDREPAKRERATASYRETSRRRLPSSPRTLTKSSAMKRFSSPSRSTRGLREST